MVRIGHILIAIAVICLIFPLACDDEQELGVEDPKNRLVEILRLTDEQLEQLETGASTLQLREDQVDIISDRATQLLDDLEPWVDEAQWQEVKGILEAILEQGEIDLQKLGPIAEAIDDALATIAEDGASVGVYTSLRKLSAESMPSWEACSPLVEGSEVVTDVIVYTPKYSDEGDMDFYADNYYEYTVCKGASGVSSADDWSGAVGAHSDVEFDGGAWTYASQAIAIYVPADNTDVTIEATLLYSNWAITYPWPQPVARATTEILAAGPYNDGISREIVLSQWLDAPFTLEDAVSLALLILGPIAGGVAGWVAKGSTSFKTVADCLDYKQALEEHGEKEVISYSASSLSKGVYVFEVGVQAVAQATLCIATAYVYGMIPEMTVTMDIPANTLVVSSTDGGSVTVPGEGTFTSVPGTSVLLVVEPDEGYRFVGWTGDVSTLYYASPYIAMIVMDGDYSIEANFEEITTEEFDLTISGTTGGSTTPEEGTHSYAAGTVVDLVATPDTGYQFVEWTGDNVDTIADVYDASTTITMNDDYSITANFEEEGAEEPVVFPDPNLEAAIREAIGKPTGDIYASDLVGLTHLYATERNIVDLTGLEHCINLADLHLSDNQISDISPVEGLTNLTYLYLLDNPISDISPVAGLTSLIGLYFWNNQISDISPVEGLTNLTELLFQNNQISDISSVAGLTNLRVLGLMTNQISDISPVEGLTSLDCLALSFNQISDISPVEGLTGLTVLYLGRNQIGDISPVAGLINLADLSLYNNQISDISPVEGLTNLTDLSLSDNQISDISALVDNPGFGDGDEVRLSNNPLSDESITIYIPELEARGVTVTY